MKRLIGLIRQDITLMLRDSIVIYIAFGPILMALALRLFMPSVEDVRLNFMVQNSVSEDVVAEIARYGNVEMAGSYEEVLNRVVRPDMVSGIVQSNDKLVILFEGNEPKSLIDTYRNVLSEAAGSGNAINLKAESLDGGNSFVREIMSVLIIMTSIFLGGVAAGFNIVGEKSTMAIRALAVSPLRMREFTAARGILSFIVAFATTMAGSLIIAGSKVNYLMLIVLLVSSCTIIAMVSLLIGRLANNQISAISAIKFVMPVFLTVPLISIFLPGKLQMIMYPLPNYWQFRALRIIFSGTAMNADFWLSVTMTFVLGSLLLVLLSGAFKKHFGIR